MRINDGCITRATNWDDASPPSGHYVYVHRRPSTGDVFYVGKGQGKRAWRGGKCRRNPHWTNVVRKEGGFSAEIIAVFSNEVCALGFEVSLIRNYGLDNLVNITEGGEGVNGYRPSDDVKAKISASLMEYYKEHQIWNKGETYSEDRCKAMSEAMSGEKHWNYGGSLKPETVEKIVAFHKGRKRTEETRKKMSESRKGLTAGHKHHQYDPTVYIFIHKDHGIVEMTKYDLREKYGLCNKNLYAVTSGKRKSHKGWSFLGVNG